MLDSRQLALRNGFLSNPCSQFTAYAFLAGTHPTVVIIGHKQTDPLRRKMVAHPYLDGWSAITKFALRITGTVFSFILLCVCIAYMATVPAAVFGFFVALVGLALGIFYLIVHWYP